MFSPSSLSMHPLIDGDILKYEIGFSGEIKDEDGNRQTFDFDKVAELLDRKIELICDEVGATTAPTIFLTGDSYLFEKHLKKLSSESTYTPNFREELAITKGYKANRKQEKPFHYYNITEYMLAIHNCVIAEGMEADDLMCIWQMYNLRGLDPINSPQTIICSRDKDLRQCPGWHYSWECGRQPSIGPIEVDEIGTLERQSPTKIFGTGLKLFYYQVLVGDAVDNIPGLKGYGPAKCVALLGDLTTEQEMWDCVVNEYKQHVGEDWKTLLKEQINLVWMCQEMDEQGAPILFNPKKRGLLSGTP